MYPSRKWGENDWKIVNPTILGYDFSKESFRRRERRRLIRWSINNNILTLEIRRGTGR